MTDVKPPDGFRISAIAVQTRVGPDISITQPRNGGVKVRKSRRGERRKMGRSDIGMKPVYLIVGLGYDDEEHMINYSYNENWFIMMARLISFKFKRKFRARYRKIYLRKFYD